MKKCKRILAAVLVLLCLLQTSIYAQNPAADYLRGAVPTPSFGSIGGCWSVIALARSAEGLSPAAAQVYADSVRTALEESGGALTRSKYTEYSRAILGLGALGYDVTNFHGYDLTFYLTDFANVKKQGINGPVFALIALDSGTYEMQQNPDAAEQNSRAMMIDYILERQLADGGFALGGEAGDADVTAMVLQALTRYKGIGKVQQAIDKALSMLSSIQQPDGGFATYGVASPESASQVIIALTGLGIDINTDARFIKNDNTVLDALLGYRLADGSFARTPGGNMNLMSTEQAALALTAYERFENGQRRLYDVHACFPVRGAWVEGLPSRLNLEWNK